MPERSINRPLAAAVLGSSRKVAVIEGARGVGKTWMAEHQILDHGYGYVSLLDDDVYHAARRDPRNWFESLDTHMIIDEAQRLRGLPLLIKESVDRARATSPLYILTGSASIARADLDGEDPLARRAMRYRLDPFTQRELNGNESNLVDDLWGATPMDSYRGGISRDHLYVLISIGGFPEFALNDAFQREANRSRAIKADIDAILGNRLLPARKANALSAQPLLTRLLSKPGGIVNYSNLAKELEIDMRTVKAYFEKLRERFLVYALPNLKLQPQKQQGARMKVHPVDTAYSVDALAQGGVDVRSTNEAFGDVFESFVANQIVAATSWSERMPSTFFWRDTKKSRKEVDLVLKAGDEALAVEMKLATRVDSHDFDGIRELDKSIGLARGYVVYTGERIERFDENLWALPVKALWETSAFERLEPDSHQFVPSEFNIRPFREELPLQIESIGTSDANLFISYNHSDEEHLDGAFEKFLKAVCDEYEFITGGTLAVFIDKHSLHWGDDWRSVLSKALESTNFLMPQVTPRYLKSVSCRQELMEFSEFGGNTGYSRVLSLIWQRVDGLRLDGPSNEARRLIEKYQYIDVSKLQFLPTTDSAYRETVRHVAAELANIISENDDKRNHDTDASSNRNRLNNSDASTENQADFFENLSSLEDDLSQFNRSVEAAQVDISGIDGAINGLRSPDGKNPSKFNVWIRELSNRVKPYISNLNRHLDVLESHWQRIRSTTGQTIELFKIFGNEDELRNLKASFYALRKTVSPPEDARISFQQLSGLQVFSPRLKPLCQSISRFLEVCNHITNDLDGLIEQANEIRIAGNHDVS